MTRLIYAIGNGYCKFKLNNKKSKKFLIIFTMSLMALFILSYILVYYNIIKLSLALFVTAFIISVLSICYDIIELKPQFYFYILITKIILFMILFITSIVMTIFTIMSEDVVNLFFYIDKIGLMVISGDRVGSYIRRFVIDSENLLKKVFENKFFEKSIQDEIEIEEETEKFLKRLKDLNKK